MREAFKGNSLVYYVCDGCGLSKMDVQPPAPTSAEVQPRSTGLVCMQCNRPYAVIESESTDSFDFRCQRCGHRWTVPTTEKKKPAPGAH